MKLKDAHRSVPVPERVGVTFPRYFTAGLAEGRTPFDETKWESRSATIGNDKGAVIFEQRDVVGESRKMLLEAPVFLGFLGGLRDSVDGLGRPKADRFAASTCCRIDARTTVRRSYAATSKGSSRRHCTRRCEPAAGPRHVLLSRRESFVRWPNGRRRLQ